MGVRNRDGNATNWDAMKEKRFRLVASLVFEHDLNDFADRGSKTWRFQWECERHATEYSNEYSMSSQ